MIHEIDVERQTVRPHVHPEDEQGEDKGVATLQWGFGLAACCALLYLAVALVTCSAVGM